MQIPLLRAALGIAALVLLVTAAGARGPMRSPLDHRFIEQTALVPGTASITAYAAPTDAAVELTRFCGNRCLECTGTTVGERAFSAGSNGCVSLEPAVTLPPGAAIQCRNTCRATTAALFSGVLRP